ncbi:MAG: ketol-acid reductoisomerase, partial [Leptolinea sp.]|nr:ketol-acid reductoisomerase [Leptolinea sp.]
MAKMVFSGVEEEVVTREEFPLEKARQVLKDETVAVIGYGVQGPAQALNMRDNGINVIVGVGDKNKFPDWAKAEKDGWVPGKTLFSVEEACEKGTIIQYLMSDAAQKILWLIVKKYLTKGKAIYFSHGFSIVYRDQTGVIPPADVDVILVAPKGSGTSVRANFLDGSGINSSFAVEQDATGRALERTLALGIAVGSGYLFRTTFE